MFIIVIVAVVLVIAALIIVGEKQRQKRREDLAAVGARLGLAFSPDKQYNFDDRYPFFDCLKTGSNRYAYNILTGSFDGRPIVAFDYHYETYSTNSEGDRTTYPHHFSAVVFDVGLPIDGLVIRPEGFFDRFSRILGFDDIDFESAEFSRQFYVACRDRQLAYDVIQPETMEQMLHRPRFMLHFDRGVVIAFRKQRFEPPDFRAAMHLVDAILDGIPHAARQALEGRP